MQPKQDHMEEEAKPTQLDPDSDSSDGMETNSAEAVTAAKHTLAKAETKEYREQVAREADAARAVAKAK
eukprot:9781371-Alexandrium_andersonii.AAC.1